MKQKDIILIIMVAFVSGILSVLVSNFIISSPKNRSQKAEVIEAIVADFPAPDQKYFNSESVDPTQLIRITENTNQSPFDDE